MRHGLVEVLQGTHFSIPVAFERRTSLSVALVLYRVDDGNTAAVRSDSRHREECSGSIDNELVVAARHRPGLTKAHTDTDPVVRRQSCCSLSLFFPCKNATCCAKTTWMMPSLLNPPPLPRQAFHGDSSTWLVLLVGARLSQSFPQLQS